MPFLTWISDADLEKEVEKILFTANTGIQKATTTFSKNVIDPFSIMFEMAGFDIPTVAQWEIKEKSRKAQKSLSNAFGTFHQSILGHVVDWTDLGTGNSADLLNTNKKILAEVKNKFNTVKGSDQASVYVHLDKLVMPIASVYKGYVAYYVETIPKPSRGKAQSYDIEFTPSDNKTKTLKHANPLIRKIDGKSFYTLVTGSPTALEDLYDVLPAVIHKVSGKNINATELKNMRSYFQSAFRL